MKKIIYISAGFSSQINGASQVTKRNKECLTKIFGKENIEIYTIERVGGLLSSLSSICGSSYGLSFYEEKNIVNKAVSKKCNYAFIEGSLYGNLVKSLENKGIKTIVFCHNIELILYKERAMTAKNIGNNVRLWLCRRNEEKTFSHASNVITLNNRDTQSLQDIYNITSDIEIPITYHRRYLRCAIESNQLSKYVLFVGSDFFPNVEGAIWFITNVAPFIKYDIHIVGSCGANPRLKQVKLPNNVKVLGYVDNLDEEYVRASAVIAPIFLGSGMKTKTVEAMSYGKTIFGTKEAFIGVEGDINKIGCNCSNADDFIKAINEYEGSNINEYTLKLFNDKYTDEKALNCFTEFFSNIK